MMTTQVNLAWLIVGFLWAVMGVGVACMSMRWPKYTPPIPREGVEKDFYYADTGELWFRVTVWYNGDFIKTYYVCQNKGGYSYEHGEITSTTYISKELYDSLVLKGENDLKTHKEKHDNND